MKNYFKGLVCGLILAVAVMCIPVVAKNISVVFNESRINVNGIDVAQWGENYTLDNGTEVPYSMTYNNTTYLPIRKIGELTGKHIAYNGDTDTISVVDRPEEKNVIAEKLDANGNMWTYYTFDAVYHYLGVRDEQRGYERIYKISKSKGDYPEYYMDDEGIYFLRCIPNDEKKYNILALYKIDFLSGPNNEDGAEIMKLNTEELDEDLSSFVEDDVGEHADFIGVIDGVFYYYTYSGRLIGGPTVLNAFNPITLQTADFVSKGKVADGYKVLDNEENIIRFQFYYPSYPEIFYHAVFDKRTFTFSGTK